MLVYTTYLKSMIKNKFKIINMSSISAYYEMKEGQLILPQKQRDIFKDHVQRVGKI